ncbi:MAG: DUF4418 family protein [Euryarchaeota archaeon]|nr:DUF4418 family protein [Euryarchaeota archaeon]
MAEISKILGGVAALIGILVMVVPRYILPVCEYYGKMMETKMGMIIPMKCTWTAQSELGAGALIIISALALIASKQVETKKVLNVILAALGVIVIALPTVLIGVCAPGMPCRDGTLPALEILGGLLVITAIVGFFTTKGAMPTTPTE